MQLKVAEKAYDLKDPPEMKCSFAASGQLALCDAPTLLVMGGRLWDSVYEPLLKSIAKDSGFSTVSAIARAGQNVERFRVWHNPRARRPLPRRVAFAIEACFEPGRQWWLWRRWSQLREWFWRTRLGSELIVRRVLGWRGLRGVALLGKGKEQ